MSQDIKTLLPELKLLAEAATMGPWHRSARPAGPFWHIVSDHSIGGRRCISGKQAIGSIHAANKRNDPEYAAMFQANADFIAAANPAALLSLIAHIEALERQLAECQAPAGYLCVIEEADFEHDTVTLKMEPGYSVRSGRHVLAPVSAPITGQPK